MADGTSQSADGSDAAEEAGSGAEPAADASVDQNKPTDSGTDRARADRDVAAAEKPGARTDGEKDEKDTYDPEDVLPLRHKRVQGRQLFSKVAFGSRMLGDNSGQASQGDNAHAVGMAFGDVIGTATTVNVGVGGRPHMVHEVSRDRLGDDDMFVEADRLGPTVVEQLVQQLNQGLVVVVTGPPGSGRHTAAIRGLHRVLPDTGRIAMFALGPRTPLQEMNLDTDNGYVVDIGPALEQRSLGDVLKDVEGHAEHRRTRIVVVVDGPSPAVASAGCPVVEQPMPDRRRILERRLVHVHGRTRLEVARLGQEVLDSVAEATVEEVALTAAAVATALDEGQEAHAYLRDEVRRSVARRFDRPPSTDDHDVIEGPEHPGRDGVPTLSRAERLRTYRRCVMLSAAVLDGFSLQQVTDAAAELAMILHEDGPDLNTLAFRFDLPARPLLEWLEARELPTAEVTSAGRLEFRNRAVPDVAVEYVWTSHHLAVESVTRWLDGMARIRLYRRRASREVRLRAAQVVGRLASYDFAYVVSNVIEPWITSNTVSGLQATSWAVEVMAGDPRIAAATWEKVRKWSGRSRQHRRAALIVYADSLRLDQAADALALVRRIANLPFDLDYAVAAVLRSAVRVGSADEVFRLMAEWLRTIEHTRRRLEQLRFTSKVRVMSGLPAHLARSLVLLSVDDEDGTRARLLEECRAQPDFAVDIWQLALADRVVARRATEQLESWLVDADTDPDTAEVVRRLLTSLGRRASLHRRLQFHARRWITEWKGAYPDAERLLRAALWSDPPEERAVS